MFPPPTRNDRSLDKVSAEDMATRRTSAGHHRRVDRHPQGERDAEDDREAPSRRLPKTELAKSVDARPPPRLVKDCKTVRFVYSRRRAGCDVNTLRDVGERKRVPGFRCESFVETASLARLSRLYTGVPCTYLKPFINYVIAAPDLASHSRRSN